MVSCISRNGYYTTSGKMQDIGEWLTKHDLEIYIQAFVDNGITVDLLDELDQDDLKEIGLNLGDRKRFLIAVRENRTDSADIDQQPDNPSAAKAAASQSTASQSTDFSSGTDNLSVPSKVAAAGRSQTPGNRADAPGAERRQLTVMFVDLVGSTSLAEQLDPEDMGTVVRNYQNLVGQCISINGGYISRYMGDGVLAYFGWPSASEDDAAHALTAALAITTGISELTTPEGELLSCRCGIATGVVVVGELIGEGPSMEHTVVGETPNLAARLQGLAAQNTTVVSDATRRLVANHFEFESLGLQELKGIREPAPVFRVIGAKTVESRFHASQYNLALPLVGRQRQLEQLRFYWQQSVAGHAARVLLQGEAGIGKSRLLHAFIDSLGTTAFNRVILQCDPLHADSPLYPASQFVIRLAGIAAADSQTVRLQKLQDIAAHLPPIEIHGLSSEALPLLADLLAIRSDVHTDNKNSALSRFSAEQIKALTLHALARVMNSSTSTGTLTGSTNATQKSEPGLDQAVSPVLLVLEDAHWIDPTTIELLSVLAQFKHSGNTMLIITARPEFDGSMLPFEDLSTIQLPRLDAAACRQVVNSIIGGETLPDSVLNEIVEKTDGVPLFAEELTKTVIESDVLTDISSGSMGSGNENRSIQNIEIPSSLHDSLMSRLDRLQSPREVAQTAACLGREFSFELLLAVSPVAEAGLRESLQTLVEAGLVFSNAKSVYSFKHALVRDTAYESLLRSKRQQIHIKIGEALQREFPELLSSEPELAGYHFNRGANYVEASGYWLQAAKLALQRVANQEAIAHAGSGLSCLDLAGDGNTNAARKYELLFARGMGYMAVQGYAAEAVSNNFSAALDLASVMDDNERYSQAARGVVTAHIVSSRFAEGLALADTMLEKANTHMQRFFALRMQGQIYLWQARFEDSRHCLEQAIELYDADYHSPLSQWDDGVLCTGFLGITLTCLGQTDIGEQKHRQSVEMANHLQQPFSQCQAMESWITSILLRGDDFSEQLSTFRHLADTHKMVFFQACAQMYAGIQEIRNDAVDSGIKVLTEGLSLYQACQSRLGVPKWMTYVAEGYQYAGQHDQTLLLLDSAKDEMDSMGNEYFRAEWTRVRAESLAVVTGSDPLQPQDLFKEAISLACAQGAGLFELTSAIGLLQFQQARGRGDCDIGELCRIIEKFSDQQSFAHLAVARGLADQESAGQQSRDQKSIIE